MLKGTLYQHTLHFVISCIHRHPHCMNIKMSNNRPTKSKAKMDTLSSVLAVSSRVLRNDVSLKIFENARENSATYCNQQNHDEVTVSDTIRENIPELYQSLFEQKDLNGNCMFYSHCSENNKKGSREQKVQLFKDVMKTVVIKMTNKRNDELLQASTTNSFLRRCSRNKGCRACSYN